MTDARIVAVRAELAAIEAEARAYWQLSPYHVERDHALQVVRLVTPVLKEVNAWILDRADVAVTPLTKAG